MRLTSTPAGPGFLRTGRAWLESDCGSRALAEEKKVKRSLCVSLEPRRRQVSGITILPFREFLDALWAGEYHG